VVAHAGGWIGWNTLMSLLPEHGVGVAVFTNHSQSPVPDILTHFIFDRVCGKEAIPWLDRFRARRRKFMAQQEVDRQERTTLRRAGTAPSHELAEYAGDYDHPAYGKITIARDGDGLHWRYRGMFAPLAHRHFDTFELPEEPLRLLPDRLAISFATDREGNIASLSAPFEPMVKDIVFARCPAGDCMDATFRSACVGIYSHGPMTHAVAQDADGQLTLSPANQPTYKLRPYQGRTFTIVELEGYRVEFRRGPGGNVDELIFHQPNGMFVARRSTTGTSA
jgi:hypothetical protein